VDGTDALRVNLMVTSHSTAHKGGASEDSTRRREQLPHT